MRKNLLTALLLFFIIHLFGANSEQSTPHYYVYKSGWGEEKQDFDTNTFVTLNLCMFKGRLPSLFGGTTAPVVVRAERLARLLAQEAPDIFVAQEVPLESGEIVYRALKEQYPHFWIGIGLKPGIEESDLFVASKYPLLQDPIFVPFPEAMQRVYQLPPDIQALYPKRIVERGFFCLQTDHFWMITTHMEPGSRQEAASLRASQLRTIAEYADRLSASSGKPYLLAGDLNITRTAEADDEYSTTSGIPELFYDFYTENHPLFDETTYTCTNMLTYWVNDEKTPVDPRGQNEIDDYVLIRKGQKDLFKNLNVQLVTETYDLAKDPQEALSDHRAYKATFSIQGGPLAVYERIGEVKNYWDGHAKITLRKQLKGL